MAHWPKSKEDTGRASTPGGARLALWGRAVAPLRARRAKGVARSRPLARVFSSTADFWRVAPRPVGPSFANKSCSIAAAVFFLILGRNNSNSASACNGVRSMSRALAVFQNCNSYWHYYCICNCCGALQPHFFRFSRCNSWGGNFCNATAAALLSALQLLSWRFLRMQTLRRQRLYVRQPVKNQRPIAENIRNLARHRAYFLGVGIHAHASGRLVRLVVSATFRAEEKDLHC